MHLEGPTGLTLKAKKGAKRFLIVSLIVWTSLTLAIAIGTLERAQSHARTLALQEARANFNKDLAFRRWATLHGGVYVKIDARTQPNPYLAHIPNRDITTLDGQRLTLMNPAFMMRQMTEEFEETYGIKGSITGLVQINPINAPDPWEREVLEGYFEDPQASGEVHAVEEIEGAPFLRMMRPMFMTQGCVKCHGFLGFKDGDLRGGISVSIPLTAYLDDVRSTARVTAISIGVIWLIGVLALLGYARQRLKQLDALAEAQETLRESEARFSLATRGANDGLWDWVNIAEDELWWSPRLYEQLGLKEEDVPDLSFAFLRERVHPEDLDPLLDAVERHLEAREPFNLEYRVRSADGSYRWFLGRGQATWGEDGAPQRMTGFFQDITARKRVEADLRRSSDIQASLNELLIMSLKNLSLPDILGRFIEQVTEFEWLSLERRGAIFVYNEEKDRLELVYERNFSDEVKRKCARVALGQCLCGAAAQSKQVVFSSGFDERHIALKQAGHAHGHYCVPIIGSKDQLLGVFNLYTPDGIARREEVESFLEAAARLLAGIIERRKVEEDREALQRQLLQSQKMEAVGTLASGIAHDFNNLLQAISGYSQLLLVEEEAQHPEYIAQIEGAASRAAELVRGLLAFGRKSRTTPKRIDLGALTARTVELLRRTLPPMITIEVDVEAGLPAAVADPNQLEQVLMNLGTNARDAMSEGGVLRFEVLAVELDAAYCDKHLGARPGRHVCVRVSDTGCGIPEEELDHIFEPFYTTKEVGKGTGLGLATVYGIVKDHQGHITCDSARGRGTTFNLYLPSRGRALSEDAVTPIPDASASRGDETILVVDDEDAIRALCKAGLEVRGYRVLTADSGEAALRVWDSDVGAIDLVILDLGMPGMGGRRCLQALRRRDPDIKVIVASGYSVTGADQGVMESGARSFIGKPYSLSEMAAQVRAALDTPA